MAGCPLSPKGLLLADVPFSEVNVDIFKVHVNDIEAGFSDAESRLQRCETALNAFLTCRQMQGKQRADRAEGSPGQVEAYSPRNQDKTKHTYHVHGYSAKSYLDKKLRLHLQRKGSRAKTGSDISLPGHYPDNRF